MQDYIHDFCRDYLRQPATLRKVRSPEEAAELLKAACQDLLVQAPLTEQEVQNSGGERMVLNTEKLSELKGLPIPTARGQIIPLGSRKYASSSPLA